MSNELNAILEKANTDMRRYFVVEHAKQLALMVEISKPGTDGREKDQKLIALCANEAAVVEQLEKHTGLTLRPAAPTPAAPQPRQGVDGPAFSSFFGKPKKGA